MFRFFYVLVMLSFIDICCDGFEQLCSALVQEIGVFEVTKSLLLQLLDVISLRAIMA